MPVILAGVFAKQRMNPGMEQAYGSGNLALTIHRGAFLKQTAHFHAHLLMRGTMLEQIMVLILRAQCRHHQAFLIGDMFLHQFNKLELKRGEPPQAAGMTLTITLQAGIGGIKPHTGFAQITQKGVQTRVLGLDDFQVGWRQQARRRFCRCGSH